MLHDETRFQVCFSINEEDLQALQENHYYPFGLTISDLSSSTDNRVNKYQYNGKEFQSEGNIGLLDYGARYYDPQVGRWWSVDPLAEKMSGWSPYSYTFNNSVFFIDPDGRMPMGAGDLPYLFQKIGQLAEYVVNDLAPTVVDKTVETFSAARETKAGQFVEEIANETAGPLLM